MLCFFRVGLVLRGVVASFVYAQGGMKGVGNAFHLSVVFVSAGQCKYAADQRCVQAIAWASFQRSRTA
jgi:hypothetical protein